MVLQPTIILPRFSGGCSPLNTKTLDGQAPVRSSAVGRRIEVQHDDLEPPPFSWTPTIPPIPS